MIRGLVITVQKHFDHYYRPGARLLVQKVKSHKLTSNACQVTFFVQIDAIAVLLLTPIECDQQNCNSFKSNDSIDILKIAKLNSLSMLSIFL